MRTHTLVRTCLALVGLALGQGSLATAQRPEPVSIELAAARAIRPDLRSLRHIVLDASLAERGVSGAPATDAAVEEVRLTIGADSISSARGCSAVPDPCWASGNKTLVVFGRPAVTGDSAHIEVNIYEQAGPRSRSPGSLHTSTFLIPLRREGSTWIPGRIRVRASG